MTSPLLPFPVAAAQLAPVVGDFDGNSRQILAARAGAPAGSLVVTPAQALTGGPLGPLAGRRAFNDAAEAAIRALAAATADGGPGLLVGSTIREGSETYDAAFLLEKGEVAGMCHAVWPLERVAPEAVPLPPDEAVAPLLWRGHRIGVLAGYDLALGACARRQAAAGAGVIIALSARPFRIGKRGALARDAAARALETGLPVVAVERVGGQDGDVFPGGSVVVAADGAIATRLPFWDAATVALTDGAGLAADEENMEALANALITGLRAYVDGNGFPGVVLGMSGGIDSALTAAIAVDALGADRVRGVLLPSRYTSEASVEDAEGCAGLLGMALDTVSIVPAVTAFGEMLAPLFAGRKADLTEENLQARLRMVALMAVSNKFGDMLLTTGNKSELAVGYSTIYGDGAGGYSVLKDLYKTEVFALARWRNGHRPRLALGPEGRVIPERILTKPPTAELHPGQRDDDSLPPYDILDAILKGLIEEDMSVSALVACGFDHATAARVEKLVRGGEYKRQQAPTGVAVRRHNFNLADSQPLTNRFLSA